MVEGLIGKKIGMTQSFDEEGNASPVTIIKAGPCTVIQKKINEKDGYTVLQLGFIEEKGLRKPSKPLVGHYVKSGIPPVKILREFQFAINEEVKEGDQFFVDIFQAGDKVHVVGMSKGKGFAGVVKRWGFHGGKATHGSMFHRRPGSVGASAYPSRVVKGKKLPGHMGNERVTIKNLTVIQADKENNLLVVKGAVPGANGGYLLIKKANFSPESYKPDKPKLEEVKPEKPKTEEKPEQPKPEEKAKKPGVEVKPDKPKSEVEPEKPKTEEAKPEESKPEDVKPEEVKAEPSESEKLKPEESKPEKDKAEQSKPVKSGPEPSESESSKEEKKE